MSSPTNNASSYIQWQVIRKNSAFLKRQRGIPKLFSTEQFNVKKINSIRFNGLLNKKAVDVKANKNGKGVVLTLRKVKQANKPVNSTVTVNLAKDSRRTLKTVKGVVDGYKPAHARHATFRASQYLRAVKPTGATTTVKATTNKSEA